METLTFSSDLVLVDLDIALKNRLLQKPFKNQLYVYTLTYFLTLMLASNAGSSTGHGFNYKQII